ncbi:hypothetical protein PV10_06368 [Exophiala mesophila]|uniref:Uncharacterized protein n=1 Tax=Exophiala mesophila TaxID=212818 RepID=A0A0D1ZB14_EXOME|nr:uncharacterized protein PV10_06368 [Exophiala mesophila]KIV91877.1 hypothetical protein PV10_06368 [Exophiala mesophila]
MPPRSNPLPVLDTKSLPSHARHERYHSSPAHDAEESPETPSSDESGLWQMSPIGRGKGKGKGRDDSHGDKKAKISGKAKPALAELREQWSATAAGPSRSSTSGARSSNAEDDGSADYERRFQKYGTANQAGRHPEYYPHPDDSPTQDDRYESMRAAGPSRAIVPKWREAAEHVSRDNSRAVREIQAAGSSVRDFAYESSSAQHRDPGARPKKRDEIVPELPPSFLAVNTLQSNVDRGLVPPGWIFLTHEQRANMAAEEKAEKSKFRDPDDFGNSMGGRIDRGESSSFE